MNFKFGDNSERIIPISNCGYKMIKRCWVTSTNTYIREWTLDEYANLNPNDLYIIEIQIDNGCMIDVVAHCVEYELASAYNKNGRKIMSFCQHIDYQNRKA
jgi:hypothetical protein